MPEKTLDLVLLCSNQAEPSQTKPMEPIQLGSRLEADSVWLGLKNIKPWFGLV